MNPDHVPGSQVSARWVEWRRTVDLDGYDARWELMAARGEAVHGEADLVDWLVDGWLPDRDVVDVLDAGCGTGRLAIELVRRGYRAVGVDLDPDMVERARRKVPENHPVISWHVADLSTIRLDREFDVVVMAGNIPLFCEPGSQPSIIGTLASHLRPGGLLVCGWSQETHGDAYRVEHMSRDVDATGMSVEHHFAAWDRAHSSQADDYAVVVARRR